MSPGNGNPRYFNVYKVQYHLAVQDPDIPGIRYDTVVSPLVRNLLSTTIKPSYGHSHALFGLSFHLHPLGRRCCIWTFFVQPIRAN